MGYDVGMSMLSVRNVHEALPRALALLRLVGQERNSRNGSVLVAPWPVTTVYARPAERVLFWPERDANPFLHLYESLWILAGRNDAEPLFRYAENFRNYSDDGKTFHAPYGYRWRRTWGDQLEKIARRLTADPDDRRCVLQTWAAHMDLDRASRDIPCNVMLTFQRGLDGELNVVVFQRSADIVWGTYGANAVQMSMLQEYMAAWIGCPIGTLTQVSVNWHAYRNVFDPLAAAMVSDPLYATPWRVESPYDEDLQPEERSCRVPLVPEEAHGSVGDFDVALRALLDEVDRRAIDGADGIDTPFFAVARAMLRAHQLYREHAAPERYDLALAELDTADRWADWIEAGKGWVRRRRARWEERMRA